MNLKTLLLSAIMAIAVTSTVSAADEYKSDPVFIALRDTVHEAFNMADSVKFFPAIHRLEDYLLQRDETRAYYTQRCNEIVFMMNTQQIFEAYKAAKQMSKELREKNLNKEMYMAINMMGHIYNYCGKREAAKAAFFQVIDMMQKQGIYESMPPIYMNIVNVELDDSPEEGLQLLEKAAGIARQYAPERVFDIETRRAISYYNMGNMEKFIECYNAYKQGEAKGLSSVHGRTIEVYYQAYLGHVDKAVQMARESLGDESDAIITNLYKNAGRWEEAYESMRKEATLNDSITNVILANSMDGLEDELRLYESERRNSQLQAYVMLAIIMLLIVLMAGMTYIVFTRRKHLKELNRAYQRALESDKMKTAFIQNMSHEVRTPLNIITGFAQVISDPDLTPTAEERTHIAHMMLKNTHIITTQIEEMIELSLNENTDEVEKDSNVNISDILSQLVNDYKEMVAEGVSLHLNDALPSGFRATTNSRMLHRMVSILLDNASKYTSEGSITVNAMLNDEQHLLITVEDTGCGIPAEEVAHVFERFVKLDTFKEGLGLGLPLCRLIATRMKGTVDLDTTYGGPGSRFVLTLPLE